MKYFRGFKNVFYMLRIIDSKSFIINNIVNTCLNGFKNSVLIVFFLDKFLNMIEAHDSSISIFKLLVLFSSIYILIIIFNLYFTHYYRPSMLPIIQKKISTKLYNHSIESDLESFDDPDFYNDYIYAMQNMHGTIIQVLDDFAQLINNILITIFVSGIFISINMIIMGTVIFSVGVTVFLYFYIIKIRYQKEVASLSCRRKSDYYKRIFYLKDYAKELRMTPISNMLIEKFNDNISELLLIYRKYGIKLMLVNTLNGLTISILLDIGLMILLSYQFMVSRTITLGEFTAASYGIWSLFSSLNGLMFGFNRFPEHSIRIQKMMDFLKREPRVYVTGNQNILKERNYELKIENINFSYSPDGPNVLENLSLRIRPGEKIAIVGENGSGKSTLIKIILGLYEPTNGQIFINNQNIKEIRKSEYRQLFASVFQDYSLFSASIAENVALDIDYDPLKIIDALKKSVFYEDETLKPLSIDATLTREFDKKGVVLSGGQSQKLIIARAFLDRDFSIMDEPSSSLDVKSEAMLNEIILNDKTDKAKVIISHRLSTAKCADRIIVLSKGRIVEEGNHYYLMQQKGIYQTMFQLQADKYSHDL